MFRATKLGTKWYALRVDKIDEDELENINTFVEEGTPVILADSIEAIQEVLIDGEIEVVSDEAG